MRKDGVGHSCTSRRDADKDRKSLPEVGGQTFGSEFLEPSWDRNGHVRTLLELFPDANVDGVNDMFRQASDDSSNVPAPRLRSNTTFANANEKDRRSIMSFLKDMFPDIPVTTIQDVLMKNSTDQGVAVLSELGPTARTRILPCMQSSTTSLIDSDDERDEPGTVQTPWRKGLPPLSSHRSMSENDIKSLMQEARNRSLANVHANLRPTELLQRRSSFDSLMKMILKDGEDRLKTSVARMPSSGTSSSTETPVRLSFVSSKGSTGAKSTTIEDEEDDRKPAAISPPISSPRTLENLRLSKKISEKRFYDIEALKNS